MQYLQIWLLIVASLSIFAAVNGYFNPDLIKERQFNLAGTDGDEIFIGVVYSLILNKGSDLTCRVFSVWTLLATGVRFICAFHINEKGIYR